MNEQACWPDIRPLIKHFWMANVERHDCSINPASGTGFLQSKFASLISETEIAGIWFLPGQIRETSALYYEQISYTSYLMPNKNCRIVRLFENKVILGQFQSPIPEVALF
jgi:hypothetical protein